MIGLLATPLAKPQKLAELRERIDSIDLQIVSLLNQRADVVKQVGRLKRQAGMPVAAPQREQEVFRNVMGQAKSLPPEAVKRIYERIIGEMKAVEDTRH